MATHHKIIGALFLIVSMGAGCTEISSRNDSHNAISNYQAKQFDAEQLQQTTRSYFNYLDLKQYQSAYNLFSTVFQNKHPFNKWREGYKNTLNHTISTINCSSNSCTVNFVATENTNQQLQKKQYTVRYDFVDDDTGYPKINFGTLISQETNEIIKTYDSRSFGDGDIVNSLVEIICTADDTFSQLSTGSGTIIGNNGEVLSNYHVKGVRPDLCIVYKADSQGVTQTETSYNVGYSIVEDPINDIWVFQLNAPAGTVLNPMPLRPCNSSQVSLGDNLRTYGFPWEAAHGNLIVTEGLISGINRALGFYVTSAKIDHGNSGGAAVNTSKNCFLGIPTQVRGDAESYGQILNIDELVQQRPELFASLKH